MQDLLQKAIKHPQKNLRDPNKWGENTFIQILS